MLGHAIRRAAKVCDRERPSDPFCPGWIEADSPDIEEAAATRYEVDALSIGRPAGLVIPMLVIRDCDPCTTRSGNEIKA